MCRTKVQRIGAKLYYITFQPKEKLKKLNCTYRMTKFEENVYSGS